MFGFVKPVKSELRIRETERFQSVYCGLCHAIRRRYGNLHTLFLSYDMTFLALLLESLREEDTTTRRAHCAASPIMRKCVLCEDDVLERTADVGVLLVYHKTRDSVADEHGAKRLMYHALQGTLRRGYRRASTRLPDEDKGMRECLDTLALVQEQKLPSLDRAADPFAQLLMLCAPADEVNARALRELLYHLGRWIYLIDACADVREDWNTGSYNPVILRYELHAGDLEDVKQPLEKTLERSLLSIYAAFGLLKIKRDRELLENIICMGLPSVTRQVLDGTYQSNGGHNRHGSL